MEAWVGPAIVAAVISGLVSLVLVQLNFRQSRRVEQLRRDEKIRDFQIASQAEIRSEFANLNRVDLTLLLEDVKRRYAIEPGYFVAVPRIARNIVFDAVVKEIHILPEAVSGPVVFYARQRQTVEQLAEDMRDASFKALSPERQLAIYTDYLAMWDVWRDLASKAETALEAGKVQ